MSDTALVLAHRVHDLRGDSLSHATREAALCCVLDLLTAAGAGVTQSGAMAARRAAVGMFASGNSDIWFAGLGAHPAGALLANSAAASALDLDDGSRPARGHPGAAVIPTAWAMLDADGCADEFLAAIVVGYEIAVRMAMGRLDYAPSGAWSCYGAIAAAGRLLRLRPEVLAHAFAIAAQTAPALPGLAGLMGSDVKEGIPWGSVSGFAALQLAREGFTGPTQILDDAALFAAGRIRDCLGGAPLIEGTYFKPYACCRHVHAAIEAYRSLAKRHRFSAADVISITVHTYRATFNLSNLAAPRTVVEAQYSVPFCVALHAVRGEEALVPLEVAALEDGEVHAFARRVIVAHDPAIDACFPERSPARVDVITTEGTFASELTDPRGDPTTPLSWEDLEKKFKTATRKVMPQARQDEILLGMERLRLGELAPLRAAVRAPLHSFH